MDAEIYFPPTMLELYLSINMSFKRMKVHVEKLGGL
jgi:hypothetical protein